MHHTNFYNTYPGLAPQPPAPALPPRPLTRREQKAQRRNATPRNRRRSGLLIFAAFLLVMGGCITVLLLLPRNTSSLDFSGLLPIQPPSYEEPYPDYWEDYLQRPESDTTIERAPLPENLTLTLQPVTGAEQTFQEIYDKCIPSIVSIRTTMDKGGSTGTGVVFTEDGYIITNYHVIQGGYRVDVVLQNGRRYKALLVGGDQTNDLAVLKIDARNLTPAEFGSSDLLRVGDSALAIGNPLGEELRGTMTEGIISAINRDVNSDGNTLSLIQTTAALNSGNSGGALLNRYGQVVGITNMKMTSYYDTIEGLGFAIPSVITKQVVDALLTDGHLSGRPSIGITGVGITAEDAAAEGLVAGVYVESVEPKSDAWEQGLRPGDVITRCNGRLVTDVEDINSVKNGMSVGEILSLEVYREGEHLTMEVALMERYELDR